MSHFSMDRKLGMNYSKLVVANKIAVSTRMKLGCGLPQVALSVS